VGSVLFDRVVEIAKEKVRPLVHLALNYHHNFFRNPCYPHIWLSFQPATLNYISPHRLFSPIASQGARRLDFVVLSWNTPALDFYRKKDVNILEDWNVGQLHLVKK